MTSDGCAGLSLYFVQTNEMNERRHFRKASVFSAKTYQFQR